MLQLITILNRCHPFRGLVYQHARLRPDKKSIEISVRPRRGSAAVCSRCHHPAPGYDQLGERRIRFWAFLVFLLYTMRRVDCRRCQAIVGSLAITTARQPLGYVRSATRNKREASTCRPTASFGIRRNGTFKNLSAAQACPYASFTESPAPSA